MRKRRALFTAVLVNLTFLATDVLSCSVCVTALADYFLPPIYLWVLIATTWFVLNAVVSSVTGITLKWYPKNIVLVLSIIIVITLLLLAGTFFGFGVMLVLFAPAIAAFVQSFNPRLRGDFPGGTRAIYWIGVSHLIGVACAAVLMMHTHFTRTSEKFIVAWEFTYIAKQKFQELEALGPQSLAAFRYIKEHGTGTIAAKAAERIKEIEGSQNDVQQSDQVPGLNEKIENATSQADGKILLP
jgi:uncharacterized membrane protein